MRTHDVWAGHQINILKDFQGVTMAVNHLLTLRLPLPTDVLQNRSGM
jgi:hypothetical protein